MPAGPRRAVHSTLNASILDLDNYLAPAGEVGAELYGAAFEAIRPINDAQLADEALATALAAMGSTSNDVVAGEHGFTDAMTAAG